MDRSFAAELARTRPADLRTLTVAVPSNNMASRSSSPTPSSSSSAGGSGPDDDPAARLLALEALLSASLGYDQPQEDGPAEPAGPRKKKKLANEADENETVTEAPKVEAGPTEVCELLPSNFLAWEGPPKASLTRRALRSVIQHSGCSALRSRLRLL